MWLRSPRSPDPGNIKFKPCAWTSIATALSLTPLPYCSPSLTMDFLDTAGHLQKIRHTGQNSLSLSTLGDGAQNWGGQIFAHIWRI